MEMSGQIHELAALSPGKEVGPRAGLDRVVKRKIPSPPTGKFTKYNIQD
jgi:hypothetical protein